MSDFAVIPEVWRFGTEDSIPTELALLAQDGRQDEIELVRDTQRPEKLNPSIVGAVTEKRMSKLVERMTTAERGSGSHRWQIAPLALFWF